MLIGTYRIWYSIGIFIRIRGRSRSRVRSILFPFFFFCKVFSLSLSRDEKNIQGGRMWDVRYTILKYLE